MLLNVLCVYAGPNPHQIHTKSTHIPGPLCSQPLVLVSTLGSTQGHPFGTRTPPSGSALDAALMIASWSR
jgi:hypothetical protein